MKNYNELTRLGQLRRMRKLALYVPGKRLPDIPVYVLTSQATFSGAEEFAYDLKHMGRATLIGETTGGGGHMVDLAIIQENFQVLFPFAGAINPITKRSWEGTGVEPHIHVPQAEALKTAHLKAMDDLIKGCAGDQPKSELRWELEIIQSIYDPVLVGEDILNRYTGQFGKRSFKLEDTRLIYTSPESSEWELTPLTEARFRLNEDLKFEFILDSHKVAIAVVISYRDDRPAIKIGRSK
jgi:hypothetical protein